jgi:hypothetical protein
MGGGENQTSEIDTGKASSTPTVGWEAALYLPGALAMATGLIMLCFLDGTDPTAAAAAAAAPSGNDSNNNKNGGAVVVGKKEEKGKEDDAGLTKLLQEQVFGNYRWVQWYWCPPPAGVQFVSFFSTFSAHFFPTRFFFRRKGDTGTDRLLTQACIFVRACVCVHVRAGGGKTDSGIAYGITY